MASTMPCSGFNVSTPESITISHRTKTGIASRQFSSPYKEVVPRHNGKWAAQIYAGHRRLWLGTFNSELEAALAYDRVCLKLRSAEGSHNLLNGKQCQIENNFQELYTKDQVVQMIKDHSYPERFKYFISIKGRAGESNQNINNVRRYGQLTVRLQHLFDKEITPSDVGKLNRLVVPKLHAERNFLPESQINKRDETLVFVDKNSKEYWEFRYSFWKSSQSYVLTRGWSRFVKEKQLQAGDIVSFQRCRANGKLYISVTHRPAYSRPTADSISIRCQHITYSSPPPAQLVVNPHDCQRLIEFHNKNSVLHSSVLPFQMGYCSECVDNGGPHLEEESKMGYCSECVDMNGGPQLEEESNVEGRLSNIDMTMEDSLYPTHETQDDDGGRDHITVASVSSYSLMPHARIKETTSHCIRLFGVEMGTVLKNGES